MRTKDADDLRCLWKGALGWRGRQKVTETFVNWNGDVFPCGCVVTENKYSMGNVFETSFEKIWNGEKYIAARKELLDQPNDLETICHLCKENGYYTP